MKKYILIFLATLLYTNAAAQLTYEYTASDSVCIENDFTYFISLYPNRNLVTKANQYYVVDDGGEKVFDLSAYDNLVYFPYHGGLMPVKGKDNGKFGYLNTDGDLVIPLEYEYASSFCDGVAIVRQSEKYGLIDVYNKVVVPMVYEGIKSPSENRYPVKKGKLFGLMDAEEKLLLDYKYTNLSFLKTGGLKAQLNSGWRYLDPIDYKESRQVYEDLNSFSEDVIRFKLDGKWGLMDVAGKVLLQNNYARINSLSKGSAIIQTSDRKYGLVSKDGTMLLPVEYDEMKGLRVFISAKKNDTYFFYDYSGNRILSDNNGPIKKTGPCDLFLSTAIDSLFSLQYLDAQSVFGDVLFQKIKTVSDNALLAEINDAWYLYPLDKSVPVGPYKSVQGFLNGRAIVQSEKSGKYFMINSDGQVFTEEYDEIKKQNTTYLFKQNEKWGISSDLENINTVYDKVRMVDYHNLIFEVQSDGKYGLVKDGEVILPVEYDKIKGDFVYGGVLEVWKDDVLSVVNNKGKILTKPKINFVDYSKYGLTLLSTETGFGMIDNDLEFVAEPVYEDIRSFNDGKRCAVKKNGLWGFIDRQGEYVIEPKFKSVLDFSSGHDVTGVEDTAGWHLMTDKGVFLTKYTYSEIKLLSGANNYFQVKSEGKWGMVDIDDKVVIPTRFTSIRKKRKVWELHLDDDSIQLDNRFRCVKNCNENSLKELLK